MKQNKNLQQAGFSHVLVLVLVAVIAGVGFASWRVLSNKPTKQPEHNHAETKNTAPAKEADISLQNLGLTSLDNVLVDQNAVREFSSQGLKGFYIFGDSLSGGRTNPNFEFASLKPGTKVVSAIDGVVGFIKEQSDSKDTEVFIQPKENSMWTIGYDHIVNVAVQKGETIKAGDIIGEPALQNNGLTRFEIQINKDENGVTTHYCPSVLLASSVKDKLIADLLAMQDQWEKTTGLELYNTATQSPIGCTKQTMTPAEAEGH